MDIAGITREKLVFHSLRKFFNNTLKNNKVPKDVRCQLVGHEIADDTNGLLYEIKYTPDQFYEYIENTFDMINTLVGRHLLI